MSVFPPASAPLLPAAWRPLMDETSPLADMYPTDIQRFMMAGMLH